MSIFSSPSPDSPEAGDTDTESLYGAPPEGYDQDAADQEAAEAAEAGQDENEPRPAG